MESGGNEKRIQALFSELSLEDQMSVPQFGHLWSRAKVVKEIEVRDLGRPLAVAISIIVTASACSLAAWSWYRLTATPVPEIVSLPRQEPIVLAPVTPVKIVSVSQPERVQPRRQRNIGRRAQADRKLATEAALLSAWYSPTQQFMESPTGLTLSSLPQLNQSVKDLESFLSKN